MRNTYNRQFRKNGLSFLVQNTYKQDMNSDNDKYYLTIKKGGIYKIVYDRFTWEIPKFRTIHDAQVWALLNSDVIGVMDF